MQTFEFESIQQLIIKRHKQDKRQWNMQRLPYAIEL